MPHHESGLLAFKTLETKVLNAAIAHFRALEPNHSIDVVRADRGRGIWLCFGSVISRKTDQHVDMSAFSDSKAISRLAKRLGVPMWVGYAIGGYSNHQFASAYGRSGKRLWTSEFDFSWPSDLKEEASDPFTQPARYHALALEMRQRAGYGKISRDFGLDYFRVISVEAGDALFATDKRSVDRAGVGALSEWLRSPWQSPEGEPGDSSEPQPPAEWVAWTLPEDAAAVKRLAGVITCALEHVKSPVAKAKLTASRVGGQTVLVLDGPAARTVSPLLLTNRFTQLAAQVTGTELAVYRGEEGNRAPQVAGVGAPGGLFSLSMRGGPGVTRPTKGTALPLTASPQIRDAVQSLRRPVAEADEDIDGEGADSFEAMVMRLMTAADLDEASTPKPRKPKARKAAKKPAAKKSVAKAGGARRTR
jgi:hypothetical protein